MLGAWGMGQGPGLGKTEEGGGSRPGDNLGRPEVGSKARAREGEWGARGRGSCAGRAGVAAVSQVIKPHEQGTGPHRPSQRRSTLGPAAPGSRSPSRVTEVAHGEESWRLKYKRRLQQKLQPGGLQCGREGGRSRPRLLPRPSRARFMGIYKTVQSPIFETL